MKNFRTYQLAVTFARSAASLKLAGHLRDQLLRASSSVVLNLAEGAGRAGRKDQKRFYQIAMASLRECQAILDLEQITSSEIDQLADKLGAHLYKLLRSML